MIECRIENVVEELSTFGQQIPKFSVLPIYIVSVLTYCDDTTELLTVFKKFLFAIPLCGAPIDCLEITVRGLCNANLQELVLNCLWEGVVHQQPVVRASTGCLFGSIVPFCDTSLLCTKIVPALVTLANDGDL